MALIPELGELARSLIRQFRINVVDIFMRHLDMGAIGIKRWKKSVKFDTPFMYFHQTRILRYELSSLGTVVNE